MVHPPHNGFLAPGQAASCGRHKSGRQSQPPNLGAPLPCGRSRTRHNPPSNITNRLSPFQARDCHHRRETEPSTHVFRHLQARFHGETVSNLPLQRLSVNEDGTPGEFNFLSGHTVLRPNDSSTRRFSRLRSPPGQAKRTRLFAPQLLARWNTRTAPFSGCLANRQKFYDEKACPDNYLRLHDHRRQRTGSRRTWTTPDSERDLPLPPRPFPNHFRQPILTMLMNNSPVQPPFYTRCGSSSIAKLANANTAIEPQRLPSPTWFPWV